MYFQIEHRVDVHKSNYQVYTKEQFIEIIYKIASQLGVSDLPDITFFNKERPIGYCEGLVAGSSYIAMTLGFNMALLDGDSYSKEQINETIKHELSHLIANRKFNEDCGHDDRWKKVAELCGCNPDEDLCSIMLVANVRLSRILNEKRPDLYFLECSQCGKEHLKSRDNLINILALFLMSNEERPLPIEFGKLGVKTPCCKCSYRFIGEVSEVMKVLEEEDQLTIIKQALQEMLLIQDK